MSLSLVSNLFHLLGITSQGFVHEVIDVEKDENIADSSINVRELNKLKKGKAVMDVSDGPINSYSEV